MRGGRSLRGLGAEAGTAPSLPHFRCASPSALHYPSERDGERAWGQTRVYWSADAADLRVCGSAGRSAGAGCLCVCGFAGLRSACLRVCVSTCRSAVATVPLSCLVVHRLRIGDLVSGVHVLSVCPTLSGTDTGGGDGDGEDGSHRSTCHQGRGWGGGRATAR